MQAGNALVITTEMLKGFRAVNGFQRWMAMMVFWLAAVFPGHGQSSLPQWMTKEGAVHPPEFGIRDEGGVFNRDTGAFKRISDRLRKLDAEHGYKIYLMVEPVLIGTNSSELAAQLLQSWLPNGGGMVVVFEADSRNVGIGRDLGVSQYIDGPEVLIPTHETAALIARAMDEVDAKLPPEEYIEKLVETLADESDGYFQRREAPLPPGRSLRIGLLAVGALTLLALVALVFGWFVKHSTMAETRSFRFPVVDRPERLGAPCGASVTARRFAARTAPRP